MAPYLELTRPRLARIWWTLAWRTAAVTYGHTLLLAIATVWWGQFGDTAKAMSVVVFLSVWALTVPLSIWVLRTVLRKRYRDFSIRLVS